MPYKTKDKRRSYQKNYVKLNKDKYKEWQDRYKNNNPIRYRASKLLATYRKSDKKNNRGECDLTIDWIIENIFTKPCVHCGKTGWNIIGCNRLDNSKPHTMDNVEPCCHSCNSRLSAIETFSKKVYQYTLDGELVKIWQSSAEAERNGFHHSGINICCNNKPHHKTYKGYRWSYEPL